ncbi:transposase [Capnocytophaga sp. ARDL2]|uniref:transposase n=1 Tax=Capnocytophaga sp. ARDL2 TaxID=3238809 RepID=UPI003558346F
MLLIGMWNNLSDIKLEEYVNDSLSAMKFCDMQLEDSVPSYSVLSLFRTELTEKKAFDFFAF